MNVWSRGVPIIPCFTDQLNTTIKLPTNSILPTSHQPTQYYHQVTNQCNTTIKLPTNSILPSIYQPTQYYHQFTNQQFTDKSRFATKSLFFVPPHHIYTLDSDSFTCHSYSSLLVAVQAMSSQYQVPTW